MNYEFLREQLRHDEGVRSKPYIDTVGKVTIGVGHNLSDLGLPQDIIDGLFERDIEAAIHACAALYPNWFRIPDIKQTALVNMAFNLGQSRLSKFKRMRMAVLNEDWPTVAAEMLDSKWARQVGDRAMRLANLMKY